MGTHDPVITYYQAARIHAQAWYEDPQGKPGKFKDMLDKDPAGAIEPRKKGFGILDGANGAKLLDLESYNEDFGDIDFSDKGPYSTANLEKIYLTGQDPTTGNQLEMKPSLWITPSGQIIPVGQNPNPTTGISLADWARIYAYIWYQVRFASNQTIMDHFERDPSSALHDPSHNFNDEIIPNLNQLSVIQIGYNRGTTSLITHGDPPMAFATDFQDISDDPNAKGYRYIVRFSC
jgi:hypothetical protein